MKKIVFILRILFAAALIWWIVAKIDPSQVRQAAAAASLQWAIAACAALFLGIFFYGWRWQLLTRPVWQQRNIRLWDCIAFNLISTFYGLFLPTFISGEAVRVWKLGSRTGNEYLRCTVTVTADRIIGFVVWLLLFLLFPLVIPVQKRYVILALVVLFVGALAAFKLLHAKVPSVYQELSGIFRRAPRTALLASAASLAGQLLYILVNYAAFRCFGIHLTLLQSCSLVALATVAGLVPISWLGVGVREGIYIGILPLFGATSNQILLVVGYLVSLNYALGVAGGLIELIAAGGSFATLASTMNKVTLQRQENGGNNGAE